MNDMDFISCSGISASAIDLKNSYMRCHLVNMVLYVAQCSVSFTQNAGRLYGYLSVLSLPDDLPMD